MDGVPSTGSISAAADASQTARQIAGRLLLATLIAFVCVSVGAATAHAAARSMQVKFTNSSDSTLTLVKKQLDHGCWSHCGNPPACSPEGAPREPPPTIPIGAFAEFESESCGVATGTEFHVAYRLANGTEMEMHEDVPFCSNVLCEVEPTCEESAPEGYEIKHEGCNSTNVVLTVSFRCDSTGCDGIPDEWKKNGVVINPKTGKPDPTVCEGLLFCPSFINLPAMGVSLDRPNVLIQMDWMQETEGKKRNQQLSQAAINKIIEAFDKNPVTYPGATRPGITLIVDNGPESTLSPGGKTWGELSRARAIPWEETFLTGSRAGFNTENYTKLTEKNFVPTGRVPIFHYAVAVAALSAEGGCTSGLTPSAGTKKGFGLIVSLGGAQRENAKKEKEACWEGEVGSETQQLGTFMHELGHALGLKHGGEDEINFKPNYPSVMSYLFQFPGVLRNEERVFDYSREPEPSLEEKTLTEKAGISLGANPLKYGISWICANGAAEPPTESTSKLAEVDWNCDKKIEEGEGFIVNGAGGRETEAGKEKEPEFQRELKGTEISDWGRIDFHTGGVGTGAAAESDVSASTVVERGHEITPEIAAQVRTTPRISYTGALTGHYHDSVTASATLVDPTTKNAPLVDASIAFKLGASEADACSATTDSSGAASCAITPTQESGAHNIVASFAGNSSYQPVSDKQTFTITPEETTMSYTGPTVILAGASGATLTAKLVEDGTADNDSDGGSPAPVPSETVTLAIGTQTCSAKTDAAGNVSCTIPLVSTPLGPETVGAVFAGDGFYSESSASKTAIVFAFPSRGVFTLGDKTVASASETTQVTWWADTWSTLNSLSGGLAPPAFKGFAPNISLPTTTPPANCGSSWTTTGGNSPPPTSGVPSYMGTVVTGKVIKRGATITSGNTVKIVVVKINPGYSPEPSHHGTGTIVATFC